MKISMNVEADSINVLVLNMGKMAVEVEGIELAELINIVNDNGYTLTVTDVPGEITVNDPLPAVTRFNGIQCSTAHIKEEDNSLLHALSQQFQAYGGAEWVHYTGSGYLIRLDAWTFPVLRLKREGLSRACRRLIITLMRRYGTTIVHFDAFGELLPGAQTFDW